MQLMDLKTPVQMQTVPCLVNTECQMLLEISCLGQRLTPASTTVILISNSTFLGLGLSPITQE